MEKKLFAVLAVLLVTISMVFAGGATESNSAVTEDGAPRIVYFMQPPANYKPTDAETLKDIQNKILEDTGVFVDYILAPVDPTEYKNKLNLLLAGGEQIDIFTTTGWEELQKDGMLADITDAIAKYPDLYNVFGGAIGGMKSPDGRLWGVPRNGDAVHYPVWIRADWLEKYGLDIPQTIEEYENCLRVFAENDPAGNGKTIPLMTSLDHFAHCFLGGYTDNGTGVYVAEDGTCYPYFMDPGYKELLMKMNEWYEEGLMDKETFVFTDNQRMDLIKQGNVGSVALWYSRVTFSEPTLQKLFPEAKYIKVELQGPKGYTQTVNTFARMPLGVNTSVGTNGIVISKNCKNVDAALAYLNWGFTNKENFLIARYGLEGKGWEWVDEDKGIFDLIVPQTGDELCVHKGLVTEMQVRERVSPNERHVQYIYGKEIVDFHAAKYPVDGGMHFDAQKFYDVAPNFSDVMRIYQEDSLKFITGVKSFSEYPKFLESLRKAGVDDVAAEITRQFNEMKNN